MTVTIAVSTDSTALKLAALELAALSWHRRPELRCQFAMSGIYQDAGWLPRGLAIPEGDRDWARTQTRSLIAEWVEGSGLFHEVDVEARSAGDLLGFRLGHTVHHCAMLLGEGSMAHVFGGHGVQLAPCIPLPWLRRLEKVWRPVFIEGGADS